MANTIMTAKNGFLEGLIMDLSPENNTANSMTSALNATLITYNGNEMALQNDMGNARVETAFLPEGYIPIGSCEFGDIIYVVSYNPLINKSLIGCFPSPERNISSDEIGGMELSLSWLDFLEGTDAPNGRLKASSVKKILYGNRYMNSGDKYIIYSDDLSDDNYLSDYGNPTHEHGKFPKLVKVHVVSIEESGKIVYLDSSTKWYDNNYYLNSDLHIDGNIKDLDSHRDLVSSAYSVFSSKISGKLALLIELEKISGFSCSWEPYVKNSTANSTTYTIYMHFNWQTNNKNINPNNIVLIDSKWIDKDPGRGGLILYWSENKLNINDDGNWSSILPIPVKFNNSEYTYIPLTRVYEPEKCITDEPEKRITYETFVKNHEYNGYIKNTLNTLVYANIDIADSLLNPYKIVICKDTTGAFDIGKYYINCDSYVINKKDSNNTGYYTQTKSGKLVKLQEVRICDDIVNNYFLYPVTKKFAEFEIPIGDNSEKNPYIDNLIYEYTVAPAMPYGILEEFALTGTIDFSKINTKNIKLHTWKYYNFENTTTLVWGMDAYTEPGKCISEVVFEFYDNLGFVAAYHNKDKHSYNGTFTEHLVLNESGFTYKLNNQNAKDEITYHLGMLVPKEQLIEGNQYLNIDKTTITYKEGHTGDLYTDDSGVLYSNVLYLVKIITKYGYKDALGNFHELENSVNTEYRWFWTNGMFNEYYYNTRDFQEILAKLQLDCVSAFKLMETYSLKTTEYLAKDDFNKAINLQNYYLSLSANIQSIYGQENNIGMTIRAGLLNSYNTFNLFDSDNLSKINVSIYLAKSKITNYPEVPTIRYTGDDIELGSFDSLLPEFKKLEDNVSKTFTDLMEGYKPSGKEDLGLELWDKQENNKNYTSWFDLSIESNVDTTDDFTYLTSTGDFETLTSKEYLQYNTQLDLVQYNELGGKHKYISMTLIGHHLSKYCYLNRKSDTCPLLRPFVLTEDDLANYNLYRYHQGGDLYLIRYNKMLMTSIVDSGGRDVKQPVYLLNIKNNSGSTIADYTELGRINVKDYPLGNDTGGDHDIAVHVALNAVRDKIEEEGFRFLFPLGYGHTSRLLGNSGDSYDSGQQDAKKNDSQKISNNPKLETSKSYSASDLGGTLTGISSNAIEPGDHHAINDASLLFTPIVMGYLTQLYYLTEKPDAQIFIPDNYIYLEPNYTSYTKDVVIKLYTSDASNLLLMRGLNYETYKQDILNSVKIDRTKINCSNVDILLEECLKTFPVEFRFNYITPNTRSILLLTYVDAVYDNVPSSTDLRLEKNIIYYWNDKNFESCRGLKQLYRFNTHKIDESTGRFLASPSYTFSVDNIGSQSMLELLNDGSGNTYLGFRILPTGKGTYFILPHSKRKLINYLTGLKYFK